MKYFFSKKKTSKKMTLNVQGTVIELEKTDETHFEEKNNYNIEDLVTIYSVYSKFAEDVKNKKLDFQALELKVRNLTKKIENAMIYISEIDSHKKSIFEFWKFSSKDDLPALNAAEEDNTSNAQKNLRKVFDYENDREDVSKQIDKMQREKLTKEEEDNIFVVNSQILPIINKIKTMVKVNDDKVQELLDELKDEVNQEKNKNVIQYDIFGGLSADRTKIKKLGQNKHRETEKNKNQILGISNDTSLQIFKETLKKVQENVLESIGKVKNVIDISIYKFMPIEEKIDLYGFNIYSMNAEDELKNNQISEHECNLIKINLKENMPAIFYTNIMFYDNYNKTLPLGMDKSNSVLLDADLFSFTLKNVKTVYTNKYFTDEIDANNLITKKIHIYEYDIELKRSEEND